MLFANKRIDYSLAESERFWCRFDILTDVDVLDRALESGALRRSELNALPSPWLRILVRHLASHGLTQNQGLVSVNLSTPLNVGRFVTLLCDRAQRVDLAVSVERVVAQGALAHLRRAIVHCREWCVN
jgi:hypothetical protein